MTFEPLSTDEPSGKGFGDSPLQDFWATGCGIQVKQGIGKSSGKPYKVPQFRFIDLEVLETDEIYPYPTAEIDIFYSDPQREQAMTGSKPRGISEWAALSRSMRHFYPNGDGLVQLFGGYVEGEGVQPEQMGKRMRWKRVPILLNVGPTEENAKWHDEVRPAWMVVEVQGMGVLPNVGLDATTAQAANVNEMQYVLSLAVGKTDDAFYAAALDDPKVLANASLRDQLTAKDREFTDKMVGLGFLTRGVDGVLSKGALG